MNFLCISKKINSMYHGEQECQSIVKSTGKPCTNKAYYLDDGLVKCGVHSQKTTRTKLPTNPNKGLLEREEREKNFNLAKEASVINAQAGKAGNVILTKLGMMKKPEEVEGYYKIFPNFKHGNRQDGFGCPGLSPMHMGPFDTQQANHPIVQNLENFHQGNKVFDIDIDPSTGNFSISGWNKRLEMYADLKPHRHKYNRGDKPLYSVLFDFNNVARAFGAVDSRYFYCKYYEDFILSNDMEKYPMTTRRSKTVEQFKQLQALISRGYNLSICGYDAYAFDHDEKGIPDILKAYKDPSKPFGHERVLYTLLTTTPENYPWNIEKKDIHHGIVF